MVKNGPLGTRAKEDYTCFYAEGIAQEDGVTIKIGPTLFPISLIFNKRTSLLDRDPIVHRATRYGSLGTGPSVLLVCMPEPSTLGF
jgi:hypothetical protein